MDFQIRDAIASDADCVAALLDSLGYPATSRAAADHIERFSEHPDSRLQVADSAAGLLGLVATHFVPRMDDDQISCRITDLVVHPSARRAGIGAALLAAAEAEARRARAPRLDLSSGDWRDDAAAFYAAMGFETRSRGFTKRLP
jgi:N-acetylglutamate synthase-like GNAT family acetyltransferase